MAIPPLPFSPVKFSGLIERDSASANLDSSFIIPSLSAKCPNCNQDGLGRCAGHRLIGRL
jgi:hypothetical protein